MSALAPAIERHDQGQANRDLGGGHRDHEKHEDLAIQVVIEPRKGHQGQVSGVQHQFEAHVHYQQVAPDDHAQQTQAKQDHTHHKIMFDADGVHFSSFLLSNTTPTMATSSRMETISKGSR